MFFDRYEIHIQAFLLFINGKLIIFNSHLHKSICKICTQKITIKSETKIEQNWYLGDTDFDNFRKFMSPVLTNIIYFQNVSIFFLYS